MYKKTAEFYDAIYHFLDYEPASKKVHSIIQGINQNAKTLLDVGCGTGKHLEYLKSNYTVEGLDLSSEMLEIAITRLEDVQFYQGNMIDFSLKKRYDVVTCLFSSIIYVKTVDNLYKAIRSMANHLNPQGVLIVEPYISPEQYWEGRITANFVDQPDLKIAWMYTDKLEGNILKGDIHYLVGAPENVTHFTEYREVGLFTTEQYKNAFSQAGIEVDYDPVGLFKRGLYIGKKPD